MVFEYLKTLRNNILQDLEFNAGKDALQDRYNAGVLGGINEVLNMQLADIVNENDEETNDR